MPDHRNVLKQIQTHAYSAYKASGRLAALMEDAGRSPNGKARELETVAEQLERGAVAMRVLCEYNLPPRQPELSKPELPALEVAGQLERNAYGWLHIQLNTLLPHCRFSTPAWLTDTITRLLDRHERRHGKLPMLDQALLVIDEHSDVPNRQIYDQDNKGWKAISNALKGRLIPDDDQYTLGVCLLSQRSLEPACHIYLLPEQDAGDFFFMRGDHYPFTR